MKILDTATARDLLNCLSNSEIEAIITAMNAHFSRTGIESYRVMIDVANCYLAEKSNQPSLAEAIQGLFDAHKSFKSALIDS